MKTHQQVAIWMIVGVMILSAVALTIAVILSNDQTQRPADFGQLQAIDLREGEGEELELGDTIRVNYRLTLADGTEVPGNDTFLTGSPIEFEFIEGGLIVGWTEGLVGMREGGLRRLEVPSNKGYGAAGDPPFIPPNSGLIFEVELLAIISE